MVRNQIRASDVDWKIILSQIFQNQTLWIRNFTGTRKSLKLVRIDQRKRIKCQKQYISEQITEDIRIYGKYVFRCINP